MRLVEHTKALQKRDEKVLAPFLTAGYPDEKTFVELLDVASGAGCQVIEIGIPFSDPIADGPVIQSSSKRALENGMSLRRALDVVATASERVSSALVVMSYLNPILQMGFEPFAEAARAAGVSGVICPDVPFEESEEIRGVLARRGITFIDFIAPTSDDERIERIAGGARGFLYLVSLTGVTGVRADLSEDLGGLVRRVRARAGLPLYVGFGVSNREQAVRVADYADGVIIGSALIRIIESAGTTAEAVSNTRQFLEGIKAGLNGRGRTNGRTGS